MPSEQPKNDDGGPAFPLPIGSETVEGTQGMSLRDYFAGQALRGISEDYLEITEPQQIAIECYRVADAMLKARNT